MFTDRVDKVREQMKVEGVDALLISNFYSVLYLSSFKTLSPDEREAYLCITERNIYLFTDGRYVDDNLHKIIKEIGATFKLIETGKRLSHHLKEIIKKENLEKLAFEEEDLKYNEYEYLKTQLSGTNLIALKEVVMKLREIKIQDELEKIQKASSLTDQCMHEMLKVLKPGMTEKEFGWKMEVWIREHGYELAFEPIVAADKNSAVPHYDTKSGNGVITANSVVLLDFGVRYQNYNSDITRMVFMGKQSSEVESTYHSLLKAQEYAISVIKKDIQLSKIDIACRKVFETEGLPDFGHSTGHGVGLEVHESPHVSRLSTDILKESQVFTVEPGVYYQNKYGMRIEDTVIIQKNGQVSLSTLYPKMFLQL